MDINHTGGFVTALRETRRSIGLGVSDQWMWARRTLSKWATRLAKPLTPSSPASPASKTDQAPTRLAFFDSGVRGGPANEEIFSGRWEKNSPPCLSVRAAEARANAVSLVSTLPAFSSRCFFWPLRGENGGILLRDQQELEYSFSPANQRGGRGRRVYLIGRFVAFQFSRCVTPVEFCLSIGIFLHVWAHRASAWYMCVCTVVAR